MLPGFVEPPGAGVSDDPPGRLGTEDPDDGLVVGDSPDAAVVADVEPEEFVADDAPLVAALATAAPPPMRTPASATPASVCRSRTFIAFTSFLGIVAGDVPDPGGRFGTYRTTHSGD